MKRKALAVITSLIVAVGTIMIVEMINSTILPIEGSVMARNPDTVREAMTSRPDLGFIVVVIGYVLAAFGAGFIVTKMSRREGGSLHLAILCGVILTALGIANIVLFPGHPMWFIALMLISFIPSAAVGYRFAR
ncbi:MAG: hypothetical protein HS105_09675 [Chloracidobacterium sp.]|nr:hypothetical protein [Chloracidobacterium sp.]MCC6826125.1 hypothetical protein [Acidobacteriota bacterium]MCO5333314.1 hypothetical protein [Pyrinomonadaceae bacterium]